jgi:hypothetical protein
MAISVTKAMLEAINSDNTHSAPEPGHRGWHRVFSLSTCERCGAEVIEPNSSLVRCNLRDLDGLTRAKLISDNEIVPLDDGSYCCDACYEAASAELVAQAAAALNESTGPEPWTAPQTCSECGVQHEDGHDENHVNAAGFCLQCMAKDPAVETQQAGSVQRLFVRGKNGGTLFHVTLPEQTRPTLRTRVHGHLGTYDVLLDVWVAQQGKRPGGWAEVDTLFSGSKSKAITAAKNHALASTHSGILTVVESFASTAQKNGTALVADPDPETVQVAQHQPQAKAERKARTPRPKVAIKLTLSDDGSVIDAPSGSPAALEAIIAAAQALLDELNG